MASNLNKYKADLDRLISKGSDLALAMQFECREKELRAIFAKDHSQEQIDNLVKGLPSFRNEYEDWYSEALATIKQLLPDRLATFRALYEKPRSRKALDPDNYVIADYLAGLISRRADGVEVVGLLNAIPAMKQQQNILKSVKSRFESSLFEIKQLVQADIFDSELHAARELLKNGFSRAAGAISGVVLEKHLQQVCEAHNIALPKKIATISVLNDALKEGGVIDLPQWRFIQHLGDIRNLCDHNKEKDPTKGNVEDLVDGVGKITKTVF